MVTDNWNLPVHGTLDFIFLYKLKRLKASMKIWNFQVFGNINARLKQDMLRFETAARNYDDDPANLVKLNVMKDALSTLQDTKSQQAVMLKQKSRNNWLLDGASNTAFFHNSIRSRRSRNVISELVDNRGNIITDKVLLHNHVVHYYEDKFNGMEGIIDDALFDCEHDSITLEESAMMDVVPTPEEIKEAVWDLGADSAPGSDEFSGCFYRQCWDIIHEDLIQAIIFCWNLKHIPNGANSSLIILLDKILATRLGTVLDKLVLEEQVAFLKERNIHENISLALEMINELHIKRKDDNLGLKLDISQAFDTSARISILLNGIPDGFFSINRGLRQRDPLSPLIFFLIEDVLSRNISKLFIQGNMKSVRNLIKLLEIYQHASGKTVCRQKSKVYFGGGSLTRCRYLTDFLGMSVAPFPDRYLGVQVMPGDSNTRRYFFVGYDKVCTPYEEGGLGITSLSVINEALLMKLSWKIRTSKNKRAKYLVPKFFGRNGKIKRRGEWVIVEVHHTRLVTAGINLLDLPRPVEGEDVRIWMPEYKGQFTVQSSKEIIRPRQPKFEGANLLWRPSIHPCLEAQNWKILRGACASLDQVHSRFKVEIRTKCVLCSCAEESLDHILWRCNFAAKAWTWLADTFGILPHPNLVMAFKASKGRSKMIQELWLLSILVIRSELWFTRNKKVFRIKILTGRCFSREFCIKFMSIQSGSRGL
ncbi:uncharacterized protein LOC113295639 [Papaver somniferum]|uniref:uncharacterized protein LOC113295639 n=1 Tax=Papaver somniferum TaxID=3469 RepID=UPI000E702DCE|nr:uncharacterized protein LOC113295639 [Papaver somniferum]